eukprot:UN27983
MKNEKRKRRLDEERDKKEKMHNLLWNCKNNTITLTEKKIAKNQKKTEPKKAPEKKPEKSQSMFAKMGRQLSAKKPEVVKKNPVSEPKKVESKEVKPQQRKSAPSPPKEAAVISEKKVVEESAVEPVKVSVVEPPKEKQNVEQVDNKPEEPKVNQTEEKPKEEEKPVEQAKEPVEPVKLKEEDVKKVKKDPTSIEPQIVINKNAETSLDDLDNDVKLSEEKRGPEMTEDEVHLAYIIDSSDSEINNIAERNWRTEW